MFVNVNAYPGSRPTALGQLGELSRARVILSEFKYNKGTEIFGEAEPADYVYQVIDGAVRTHKLLADGRRQIGAFHLPGDIFGLENGVTHRFTAEAIVETTVRLMKRCSLEHVAETDALVALDLLTASARSKRTMLRLSQWQQQNATSHHPDGSAGLEASNRLGHDGRLE